MSAPVPPFDPQVKAEPRELALALAALVQARPAEEDTTCVTAALIELLSWWIIREAVVVGAHPRSILSAVVQLLTHRVIGSTRHG